MTADMGKLNSGMKDKDRSWIGADCGCNGLHPKYWHPESSEDSVGAYEIARPICATCPLQVRCLEYALANNIDHGMWGGTTPRERRRIRRNRRKERWRQQRAQAAAG